MATKKPKQLQTLDNGVEIKTTAEGWNPKDLSDCPVLLAGWAEKKASHHPISLGVALASKEVEGAFLGNFAAEDKDGNIVLVPVIDPLVLNEEMMNAYVEKHQLEVPKIRMATSRSGAKKELDKTNKALYDNPEVMKILEESNPELFAKLNATFGVTEEVEEEVEEPADTKED